MSARARRLFLGLMFGSGFCALVYEVAFTKLLSYIFGVTAYAVSTVLAAFMSGLALGSWLFGRQADRVRRPLRLYAALELIIGLYCVWTPKLYPLVGELYGGLAQRYGLSLPTVTLIRYALCGGFILLPTILMGGTLPVAAKWLVRSREEIGPDVSTLYAINTLGAAAGALATTYVLLVQLGLDGAIYLSAALNGLIFLAAWLLDRNNPETDRAISAVDQMEQPRPSRSNVIAIAALATGAISLAYEVIWTHVLAQAVGNSATAFGLMLFTFLLGIGAGSLILARWQPDAGRARSWAAASQFLAGLAILVGLPLWDKIPLVFLLGRPHRDWIALLVFVPVGLLLVALSLFRRGTARSSRRAVGAVRLVVRVLLVMCIGLLWTMRGRIGSSIVFEDALFWGAELSRFVCSVNVMIWPTLFLGATFPLLIRAYAHDVRNLGKHIGRVYFWNTAGAILGSVVAAFWLIPRLGSMTSLKTLACANAAVAFLLAGAMARRHWIWSSLTAAAVLALAAMLPAWNLRVLNSGANVYFDAAPVNEILFYAEDAQGGVTSVVREGETRVLLTNGKFEGNDSGEMAAQEMFAQIPLLYTRRFERALVIGLGTGRTLATLAAHPFTDIDVAELSPNIVTASRDYFRHINNGVLNDPRVHLHVTDGRNWLQLTSNQHDLITIELTSIWFAGAGNLYNREFYQWCSRRLRPDGVLQQWVQVHHMRTHDLLVIFNTMRDVFPHVHLFVSTHQGVLVASRQPLVADYRAIQTRNDADNYRPWRERVKLGNLFTLFGGLVLDDEAMSNALTNLVESPKVSSDLRPYLEYATPRGNFLPYEAWERNIRWLRQYRTLTRPEIVNVPGAHEEFIVQGCIAFGRGDTLAAGEDFLQAQHLRPNPEVAKLLGLVERQIRQP